MLPPPVLERAHEEWFDWANQGVSVMEVSHRGDAFMELARRSETRLRSLLAIPDSHAVLFLQGGASLQFALAPLNLSAQGQTVAFVDTGHWSQKAEAEAARVRDTRVVARYQGESTPRALLESVAIGDAAYVHLTGNETVDGIELPHDPPADAGVPWVADLSSNFLSRPLDLSRYGMIYAGAQKNAGIAGLALVIIRRDLLQRSAPDLPTLMNYRRLAESGSMANTPPTFAWYMADLTWQWLEKEGGPEALHRRHLAMARLLYEVIDEDDFYQCDVPEAWRSRINVCFRPHREDLIPRFLEEAGSRGLIGLKGHRAVGGLRASLYNAMPMEGVQALAGFMRDFARRHG